MKFPKFEMYELGSQVRRSSNAAGAILAEGWGSRHTNIYLEAISRSKGEVRETQHHVDVARAKGYLSQDQWSGYDAAYEVCDRMLERLSDRLSEWRDTVRPGGKVREERSSYGNHASVHEWHQVMEITMSVMDDFPSTLHLPPSTLHPPPSASSHE